MAKRDGLKREIISMLKTVNEALEIAELKSEIILVNEIIDNINDTMEDGKEVVKYKNNIGQINCGKDNSIITATQNIKYKGKFY